LSWININDQLPPEGRYVLIHLLKDNWICSDKDGVYYKVARLESGLSKADRAKMESGEIPNPEVVFVSGRHSRRSRVYGSADEHENNKRPYWFSEFGPGSYFGQEVDFWMEIPRL